MSSSSPCRQFSLDEIKEGTNNFDEKNVIGHGGEGKVYLAEIYLGSENKILRVAVKHLKENSNEFEKEIQTVTNIQHPHLVSLLGYCDESNQKILIYEYMEKGSLSDYVKSNSASICLSWKQRLNICLGAARGLQYLHKETDEFPKGIIHRDVKPANILLGENWVAKVSDFGTFKLSIAGQTSSAMITDLKGTIGYYAPECFRSFQITRKIDVYAFGMVLFEVLCGKKPWERGDESYYVGENEDLGLWAQENVDTKIKTEISYDSLNAFTDILGRSLRPDPNKRPTMDDVILALKNALKRQECEEEQILKATGAPSEGDIRSLIPRGLFEQMLLHRNDNACPAKGFYTYDAFIAATKVYPNFASVGDTNIRKREIAAFFAQTSHETTGGWQTAPDGPHAWGYCYLEEVGRGSTYCVPSDKWPCAPGKSYHGRGPIQISYNYNYGPAGQALGLDLLNDPDLVATNPTVSFETALWFWMTTQLPKPSCHDVITNNWTPSQQDVSANRLPGFGVTTNIINGGVECGRGTDARVQDRIGFYKRYCELLGVSYGDNIDCGNQRPFGFCD